MMDKLKLVKTIVFVITFLLVFGCMLLLAHYTKKLHRPAVPKETTASLDEPAGSTIDSKCSSITARFICLVKGGGLADRIIIYNPDNARPVRLKTLIRGKIMNDTKKPAKMFKKIKHKKPAPKPVSLPPAMAEPP